MSQSNKLLLSSVFGPYGVKDEYGESLGCQMELLDNQITRCQGIHSPRQSYWSFGLYLMAENVSVPTTILDFPTWNDFTEELKKGYTHVGITFIIPNVLKARRMARYIRENHPATKIIVGGYGTLIPNLQDFVPHDDLCPGEGVRWLRHYFEEDETAPICHPPLIGPAFERIYGYSGQPRGAILMPGMGCENACSFCNTSFKFDNRYVPLLSSGQEVFQACHRAEVEKKASGFSVMDENFLKRPQRAQELLVEMERHGKPYVFDLFSSAETIVKLGVDFLVRLGVRMVWIGVESRKACFAKNEGIDMKTLIRSLQDKGIIVQASSILFQEHHDEKTIQEDIDWVIGLGSSLVQFMNLFPCPGTPLYQALQAEDRIKEMHYRHFHGAGELAFEHPCFKRPADHVRILRDAFRRKYQVDGPGVLNMALTLIKGLKQGREDYRTREEERRVWKPETLQYEVNEHYEKDRFMRKRLLMTGRMAAQLRPVLWAAWVFAPNNAARRKARDTMRLYRETLGKAKFGDRLKASGLVLTGALEMTRLLWNRLRGRETIVYQPPCRRTEYNAVAPYAPPEALGNREMASESR